MEKAYTSLALKMHGLGLVRLQDPNWTGMELWDLLKHYVRGRYEPIDLLRKTIPNGLLFHLGKWLYEEMLLSNDYLETLDGEYLIWFLEDFAEYLMHHGVSKESEPELIKLISLCKQVDDLYKESEENYFKLVESHRTKLSIVELFKILHLKYQELISSKIEIYASNYADRVFHDRELCGFISKVLVSIGYNGTVEIDDKPCQWVDRLAIPSWAREAVISRERGKCANCKCDMALELSDDDHIDHIIPLASGGCNDLVNLQLLCKRCNLEKSAKQLDVNSSIPPYFSRRFSK